MAKNNTPEAKTSPEEINDTLTGLGKKVQSNPRTVLWGSIAMAVIVVAILVYVYAIRQPGIQAANEALSQADLELLAGNDSIALQKYQEVAANHGYSGGNLANLNAAILLYKQGKYEEAIGYLNNYSSKEEVIGASAKSLEGDCYINLKQYEKGLDCFKQAVKISGNNPAYTPTFLMKEATVLRELKNYKEEAAVYDEILTKYPSFGLQTGVDIRKYYERAKDAAGE